jgi:hypothetical protein
MPNLIEVGATLWKCIRNKQKNIRLRVYGDLNLTEYVLTQLKSSMWTSVSSRVR